MRDLRHALHTRRRLRQLNGWVLPILFGLGLGAGAFFVIDVLGPLN